MPSELETENAALLQFLYACPVGLLEFGADGSVRMVNPLAMQLLLPLSGAAFVTNFFTALQSCAPELRHIVPAFEPAQGTVCDGHRIFTNAGRGRPAALSCTVVKLSADRYVVALADISRQFAQERRLKEAETWFATLIDGVDDVAVLSLDEAGSINAVTPSALRQTQLTAADLIGKDLTALERPEAASGNSLPGEALSTARREGWHLHEGWHALGRDDRYWCQRLVTMRYRDAQDEQGGYTVILRAVTRHDRNASELRNLLSRDYLTGASNRAHFFELAERELARCRRHAGSFAIVAFDIDHFKRINDSAGHAAGDTVLRELTRICTAELRPEDVFARFGGEEFTILLPGATLTDAVQTAERLRRALSDRPITIEEMPLSITASFGCVAAVNRGETINDLLAAADEALYRAKHAGRDQVALANIGSVAA